MATITGWEVDHWPFCMARFLDYYTIIFKEDGAGNVDVYEAYCGTDDVWDATQIIDSLTTINTLIRGLLPPRWQSAWRIYIKH